MKKAILVAIIGAMTLGVNAGDWGKAPVGKAPVEECIDLGGEISTGWMSDHYVHGKYNLADVVWTDLNYTFDGLVVPVTIGVTYLNSVRNDQDDFLTLYASAALGTFFGFDTSLGYAFNDFPEENAEDPNSEWSLNLRRSLGFADLLVGANYMVGPNDASIGWYGSVGLERAFAITDNISLVLAGGAGYLDGTLDMNEGNDHTGSGWNHYSLRASLPIQLNCRTVLTPYVAYHNTLGQFDDDDMQDEAIHTGVSLSVSF